MKIAAVIQARMGSSRLPLKMMLSLHGIPIIDWVVKRVQMAKKINDVILAIPDTKNDDILYNHALRFGIPIFRGGENNVLKRFYDATKNGGYSHIIRVCADNPLIDPKEIDNLVEFYKNNPCDYAYNHIPKDNLYADGFGAEIISFELLEFLINNVVEDKHKEHLLTYIWDNKEKFIIKTFDPLSKELCHPELKFDIDTFDDYYKLSIKDFNLDDDSAKIIKIFSEKQ